MNKNGTTSEAQETRQSAGQQVAGLRVKASDKVASLFDYKLKRMEGQVHGLWALVDKHLRYVRMGEQILCFEDVNLALTFRDEFGQESWTLHDLSATSVEIESFDTGYFRFLLVTQEYVSRPQS
jgi:hypothetical protein